MFLNRRHAPACAPCAPSGRRAASDAERNVFGDFGDAKALYFGGDMERRDRPVGTGRRAASTPVRPVADIIADTVTEFAATIARLSA